MFYLLPYLLHAQLVPELSGARAAALGMGVVASTDTWAIQNNIGALGGLENPSLAMSFNTRLNLQELNTFGLVAAHPLSEGVAAASISRYGTGAYSLTTVGLGYSHKIEIISLGLKLNYLQQSIEDFMSQGTLVVEAGGKAQLFPKLAFGAHAYNLTQSAMSRHSKEIVPVMLKAGLEYQPVENVIFLLQTFKELQFPARLSTGLEYSIIKEVLVRTGIQTQPTVASFGIGFSKEKFVFDYGWRHHNTIGAAHHLTISLHFHSKEIQ